ncbi:hypothetical protein DFH76_001816 [Clostridium beijerinckii]|nr:hypothetical protein [Clostridium beijerinckii]
MTAVARTEAPKSPPPKSINAASPASGFKEIAASSALVIVIPAL